MKYQWSPLQKTGMVLRRRSFVDILTTVTSVSIPLAAGCSGLLVGVRLGNIDTRQDDFVLSSMAREALMMACLFVLLSLYLKAWFDKKYRITRCDK